MLTTAAGLLVVSGCVMSLLPAQALAWRQSRLPSGSGKRWHTPPPWPLVQGAGGDTARLQAAVDRAVLAWTRPSCSGLRFDRGSRGIALSPVYSYPPKLDVAAWTDVRALHLGGLIVGADIALNGFVMQGGGLDVETVILHELGHALGLAHTGVRGTVMRPRVARGWPIRTLTPDDRAAVCALYPPGVFDTRTPASTASRIAAEPSYAALAFTLALALLSGLWLRRRRASRAPSRAAQPA